MGLPLCIVGVKFAWPSPGSDLSIIVTNSATPSPPIFIMFPRKQLPFSVRTAGPVDGVGPEFLLDVPALCFGQVALLLV